MLDLHSGGALTNVTLTQMWQEAIPCIECSYKYIFCGLCWDFTLREGSFVECLQ